ncbi:hypothetical protein BDQ17DRAFT_1330045 [Cyathus striatus]|nr:hypothetical protein BDQ17DRAFT_1330045 [Cyathus striatus]
MYIDMRTNVYLRDNLLFQIPKRAYTNLQSLGAADWKMVGRFGRLASCDREYPALGMNSFNGVSSYGMHEIGPEWYYLLRRNAHCNRPGVAPNRREGGIHGCGAMLKGEWVAMNVNLSSYVTPVKVYTMECRRENACCVMDSRVCISGDSWPLAPKGMLGVIPIPMSPMPMPHPIPPYEPRLRRTPYRRTPDEDKAATPTESAQNKAIACPPVGRYSFVAFGDSGEVASAVVFHEYVEDACCRGGSEHPFNLGYSKVSREGGPM